MSLNWNELRPILNTLREGFPVAEAQAVYDQPELQDAFIADLEALAETPTEALNEGMLHIVGMILLAEKRDRRLATPLLKLTSGNQDDVDAIWGDFLTEDWANAAASVCRSEDLKAFLETETHAEWARAMAARALTIQVYEGDLERQSTLDYAMTLQEKYLQKLSNNLDDRNNDLMFDFLADLVCDLGEPAHFAHLERWFAEDILDPMHAGIEWYKKKLDTPFEERRNKALQRNEHYIQDAMSTLSSLYCYSSKFHQKPVQTTAPANTAPLWSADYGTFTRDTPKVGRNDPCPCGSGKKFKKCCDA